MKPDRSPAEILHAARRARAEGTQYLTMGASIGAMGLAGAALGAVCPLCVVATPALLGFGLLQKVRSHLLAKKAEAVPEPERA